MFTCFPGFFSRKICQFQETDSKVYFKDISKNFLTGKNSAGNSYIKLVYNIEPYLEVILRINCSASVAKEQLITFAIWNFDVGIWFSMLTDGSNGGIHCRCNCSAWYARWAESSVVPIRSISRDAGGDLAARNQKSANRVRIPDDSHYVHFRANKCINPSLLPWLWVK